MVGGGGGDGGSSESERGRDESECERGRKRSSERTDEEEESGGVRQSNAKPVTTKRALEARHLGGERRRAASPSLPFPGARPPGIRKPVTGINANINLEVHHGS
jgi:hypothetical protein